jgi:hypothetical protein
MANRLFPAFNIHDLADAVTSGQGYSFTFETEEPRLLNILGADYLLQGYRYDLTILRSLAMPAGSTKQVEKLYEASTQVDHLWIRFDPGTGEIVGSWPGT